ncbi:MAG: DUF2905 domain-containing protein [Thiovulaceae bacterium]|nr:DUF2905 domain-containing protein [Sulfurimonadaceae bacterium]
MPKEVGSLLIMGGVVLIIIGLLVHSGWFQWFGRLPGDIRIEGENSRFYFPITTMIIISVVLSFVLYLFRKIF